MPATARPASGLQPGAHDAYNVGMKMARLLAILLCVGLLSTWLIAGDKKKKDEGLESSVSFLVLKDYNGKPIRNAAVVLHQVGEHGRQDKGGFELKTDGEGKTSYDGIPYGTLRVQVIAPQFQTFGNDYNINQPAQQITIRLKRPQQQYSIYEKHGSGGENANPPASTKPQQ
ncbi:MAG TPA: hypothetical protein VKV05_12905 [Terriglobales bacterium]|nr:hypothetical protein [Terriglobales bacterium]